MRRLVPLLAALAVVGLTACGEKKDATRPASTKRLDLMLDFFPNADHAGIYQALADGDFRRAGLDVKLRVPSDPSAPLKLVAAGKVDLAISYEPEVLLARDQGLRVVSVAALVQKPLTSIISLGSANIRSVADLEGKKVGTAGIPYQAAYLRTILENAGVDPSHVKQVNVGFNLVPAMVSKRVDATLGAFWNYEGVQLALSHKKPRIIRMDRAGVPTYDELVVVAKESTLRDQGDRVRAFIQALAQGHDALRRDPKNGLDALLAANHDLDRRLQERSVRETTPAFFPADAHKPFGYQDPKAWAAYGRWLLDHHLVRHAPQTGLAQTNEFLPGQGV
ncbi:MAG: putative hydroxymethylpyrimidine transport system substrate-binding protein [Solirubrobacteraceae bacterium]|jgi:putative hydroxymethylpyrimidine transport system substrate-binding protein|nr:putative hydroxymethylpyrimidine transport system substrate-binding protein [Solirubrobacteraceae bacterium]